MITIARHTPLSLHVVRFPGELTSAQFLAAYAAIAREPNWASADTVYIVDEDVRLKGSDPKALLDQLQLINRDVFKPLDVYVLRCAAWICYAPRAWPLIEYWLSDRHSRDGLQSEFCGDATLDAARQLFEEAEVAAVTLGDNSNP